MIQVILFLCLFIDFYINLYQESIGNEEWSLYQNLHLHDIHSRIGIDEMMNLKKENNAVFITVATYGYREFTLDFYRSNSLQNYSSFFVVVHDSLSYDVRISLFIHSQFFTHHQIPVALFSQQQNQKPLDFINQGSSSFYLISLFKFSVIRYLLNNHLNVLYSDSDIILFKNPIPYLQSLKTQSIVFQQDTTLCTGFFFAKSNPFSISLFDQALNVINITRGCDQHSMMKVYHKHNLKPYLLPNQQFCSGLVFFSSHQYSWDEVSPSIFMMHNNYVRGSICKELRMLELGYRRRKEKDSEDHLYLTAESLPFNETDIRIQLTLLVQIANQLDRTLIIPPIPCSIGKGYCTLCNRELDGCFASILQSINHGFRESVLISGFLSHRHSSPKKKLHYH